jgi:hypothetical protein
MPAGSTPSSSGPTEGLKPSGVYGRKVFDARRRLMEAASNGNEVAKEDVSLLLAFACQQVDAWENVGSSKDGVFEGLNHLFDDCYSLLCDCFCDNIHSIGFAQLPCSYITSFDVL